MITHKVINFGDHSRRPLRERNVNLKENGGLFELYATFAGRLGSKVDGIVLP